MLLWLVLPGLLLAQGPFASQCLADSEVGNPINLFHIFQEQTIHLWDANNVGSDFRYLGSNLIAAAAPSTDKRYQFAYMIRDTENGADMYNLFPIEAVFAPSATQATVLVLKEVTKFGKLLIAKTRPAISSTAAFDLKVQQLLNLFFELPTWTMSVTNILSLFDPLYGVVAANSASQTCSPFTKMEFGYFYYMYANYYSKDPTAGLTLPAVQ